MEKGAQHPSLFKAHVYCGHGRPSQLLLNSCNGCTVDVRISKLDRKCGALLFVANFVALEQQIILVKTRSESV